MFAMLVPNVLLAAVVLWLGFYAVRPGKSVDDAPCIGEASAC